MLPETMSFEAYARYRRDPDAWLPALTVIARRHGLNTDLMPIHEGSNLIASNREVVIKCYAPTFRGDHAIERCGLAAAEGRLDAPVPEILFDGEIHGWPYLVLRRLPGVMLQEAWPTIAQPERLRLAEQLGRVVAALHAIPTEGLEALPHDWPAFVRRQASGAIALQREAGWSETWLAQLPDYLLHAEDEARRESPSVFLHADLTDHNLLVIEGDGGWRLSGILDFADAMIGMPEYELMAAWVGGLAAEPTLLRTFLLACGYPPEALNAQLRRRACLYTVLHRFSHMPGLMKRAGIGGNVADFAELETAMWAGKAESTSGLIDSCEQQV